MLANKHSDYIEESTYLEKTYDCVDRETDYIKKEVDILEEKFFQIRKASGGGYSNDYELTQHFWKINAKKLNELKAAKIKPYFGRIDFKRLGDDETQTYYIGKTSVVEKENDKRLVIDWRAPIASLYYSGELGEAMYTAPEGLIMGDLTAKRQYEIENRKLINIFDKGLTPMDEFLQKALWQKKDNRLKDIVTTIQSEQNDIIRADRKNTVIVQGAAGSGKTTIVLHRIAYLMYTYKNILKPENILIIVPNNLFLNYIKDVLPGLGVDEIKQSTFEDLALKLLEKDYSLTNAEDKLINLLDLKSLSNEEKSKIRFTSTFKGSYLFKEIIDKFLEDVINNIVPKTDFEINDYTIYTYRDVWKMYHEDYSYLPVVPRIERIKKHFKETLEKRINEVKDEIHEKYDKLADKIKEKNSDDEKIRESLIKLYNERDENFDSIDKKSLSSLENYFKTWTKINIEELYKDLITNDSLLNRYSSGKIHRVNIAFITKYSKQIFKNKYLEREDLSPLIYIKNKLKGSDSLGKKFSHIVVDEAQDLSPMQMLILKEISSNNSFTIVGDLSQGIHSYRGINDWNEIIEDIFQNRKTQYLTIKKCYRSTREIMNFANGVIKSLNRKNLPLAQPVLRSGDKPFVINKNRIEDIIKDIKEKIEIFRKKEYKSIAIICKTSKECDEVYKKLKNHKCKDIQLITGKDIDYNGGVVIIPSYLAKGLEFDIVMIYDCSKENYIKDELHIKLLYVAITRALHQLYIYCKNNPSELIDEVNDNLYIKL